jgi:hypothetical protein
MNQEEEEICFYYELGIATAFWAVVERHVLEVVFFAAEENQYEMISHGFFAIEGFRSKLAFATAMLIKRISEKRHLDGWTILAKRLAAASADRNRLAHRVVVNFPDSSAGRRCALIAWRQGLPPKEGNKLLPPQRAIRIRDLARIRYRFAALSKALANFSCRLHNEPESPPPIRVLRDRMQKELLRHWKSPL